MDIKKLMKQAQSMQEKMQDAQAEFANKEFQGESGGGLVTVSMSGTGEMRKISIDSSLMKESEKEMLEDLIVAAHNNCKTKADKDSQGSMSDMFGNIGSLPANLKF